MENLKNDIIGYINSLESFGSVDGPGLRYVIFLQGCAMHCQYCHNPETWQGRGESWNVADLYAKVRKYRSYWKNRGGITVSGGEPLLQMGFVAELFRSAKKDKVHTALDTAGQPFSEDTGWMVSFRSLMEVTDLVLLDLKAMDAKLHKRLTGVENENILKMAEWLSDNGKPMWIRHVLVPGLTDSQDDLERMNKFISQLKTVERVEILPYHTMGILKWEKLGIEYPLKDVPVPTDEQVKKAEKILQTEKYI